MKEFTQLLGGPCDGEIVRVDFKSQAFRTISVDFEDEEHFYVPFRMALSCGKRIVWIHSKMNPYSNTFRDFVRDRAKNVGVRFEKLQEDR